MRRLTADDIVTGHYGELGMDRHCALGWLREAGLVVTRQKTPIGLQSLYDSPIADEFAGFIGVTAFGVFLPGTQVPNWNDNSPKEVVAEKINEFLVKKGALPPLQAEIDTVLETEPAVVQEKEELVCVG